jgi:putative nucleotidyltransferase with HDIG domain
VIGTHIGNYRIVTELGSGAMGEVYFAEHTVMGRRAAVKIIREELSSDPDTVHRFINEARLVNRIGHPNIVEITDFGQVGSRYYIMMELLEGETLEERLERVGLLSEVHATQIALRVADALRAAHELGVVHRDLKPENVFLAHKPGQADVVKVLDFGIAKLMHAPVKSVTATTPGAILGTPYYMSPEQCRGDEQLDHRSDVYSLGVLLYRMLTGFMPFERETIIQILLAHMNDQARWPRELRPELSPHCEAVILKALAKRPEDRFADMKEFGAALEGGTVERPQARRMPDPPKTDPRALLDPISAYDAQVDQSRRVGTRLARILVERIHKNKLLLPSMPSAARKCLELLDDPQNGMTKVAAAIGRDPVIAGQVLRRAKSALMGRNSHVRTIDQAVARIGERQLRALLIDLSARKLFDSKNAAIRRATKNLWEHSLAVAVFARAIAKRNHDADPEVAYLSGLLHDVGKPIAASLLLEAERSADRPPEAWLASGAWLGVVLECHREVGVALARSWELPEEILLAIARSDKYGAEGTASAANAVCLANALAKHAGIYNGEVDVTKNALLIDEGQRMFKLDDAAIEALLTELRSQDDLAGPAT